MSSSLKRIALGTAAGWMSIIISLVQRLGIVPIILSYWTVDQYGLYLLMTAWVAFLWVPSRSYEGVVVFDCIKAGFTDTNHFTKLLTSASIVNLIMTLPLMVGIYLLIQFEWVSKAILENSTIVEFSLVALVALLVRVLVGFPVAIANAGLYSHGYQPKLAWLSTLQSSVLVLVPVISVMNHMSPLKVILLETGCTGIFSLSIFLFFTRKWLLKLKMLSWNSDLVFGFRLWLFSLQNFAKDTFDMFRQQGVRTLLNPLLGISELTRFTTIRTAANFINQGIGTLSTPMAPELMRHLVAKDSKSVKDAMSVVWVPTILIICPFLVIGQVFVADLFTVWTRGKLEFDPVTFAVLSVSILVSAIAQPSVVVIQSNNLLSKQLLSSLLSGLAVFISILLLTGKLKILGVAIALLLGELVALICYRLYAQAWLDKNGMEWPSRYSNRIYAVVLTYSFALLLIAFLQSLNVMSLYLSLIMCSSLVIGGFMTSRVVSHLPTGLLSRIEGMRKKMRVVYALDKRQNPN